MSKMKKGFIISLLNLFQDIRLSSQGKNNSRSNLMIFITVKIQINSRIQYKIFIQNMPFRRVWTKFEDKTLKYLREDLNIQRWSQIAQKLENEYKILGRNQKQCRERYHNHLDSSLNLGKLSNNEEKLLFYLHNQFGNRWAEIATYFQGRTDSSLKNIFHSKLRKGIRKFNRYVREKCKNEAFKIYPLNFVCKLMECYELKQRNFSDEFQLNSDFLKDLQNKLIEYAGSTVPDQKFEGWSQREVFYHLKDMLQKLQNFQVQYDAYSNQQMSEESEYVPIKQKNSAHCRHHSVKLQMDSKQALIEIQRKISSASENKIATEDLEIQSRQIEQEVKLQKKNSLETEYTQGQLLQRKAKKYSFELNTIQTNHKQEDDNSNDFPNELDFICNVNEFERLEYETEIEYRQILDVQSSDPQELFAKMMQEDFNNELLF